MSKPSSGPSVTPPVTRDGGKYDFDDGGCYCGQWEEGKAHGHGVCTGPKGQGEFSGAWHYGYEVSGVYTWPSGTIFEGQWQHGKRHGLGLERRGRWIYRGEWSGGFMGRYGVRVCRNSQAKYEGTWLNGLQDGYGIETYADNGIYQGQWFRGMRHGYGTRRSAPYGVAAKMKSRSHAHASLTSLRSEFGEDGAGGMRVVGADGEKGDKSLGDESRGGFALRARSEPPTRRRSLSERSIVVGKNILTGLRMKRQRSTGDLRQRVTTANAANLAGETPRSIRSSGSTASCTSDESALTGYSQPDAGLVMAPEDPVGPDVVEEYSGEWKNDRRSGYGISQRSDGLRYEGEWLNNRKYGYGVTTFRDGTSEEGKYKNNVLILSQRKRNLMFVRASKMRERIDSAVGQAERASQMAVQKGEIAAARMSTARDRAVEAEISAVNAREDSDFARIEAKRLCPEFRQPGTEVLKQLKNSEYSNSVTPPIMHQSLTDHLPSNQAFQCGTINPKLYQHHNLMSKSFDQSSQQRSKSVFIPKSQLSVEIDEHIFVPEHSGVQISPTNGDPSKEMYGAAIDSSGSLTAQNQLMLQQQLLAQQQQQQQQMLMHQQQMMQMQQQQQQLLMSQTISNNPNQQNVSHLINSVTVNEQGLTSAQMNGGGVPTTYLTSRLSNMDSSGFNHANDEKYQQMANHVPPSTAANPFASGEHEANQMNGRNANSQLPEHQKFEESHVNQHSRNNPSNYAHNAKPDRSRSADPSGWLSSNTAQNQNINQFSADGSPSSTLNKSPSCASSRYSLLSDHFEQYGHIKVAGPGGGRRKHDDDYSIESSNQHRNLNSQSSFNSSVFDSGESQDGLHSGLSSGIVRRSTLATAKDRFGLASSFGISPGSPSPKGATGGIHTRLAPPPQSLLDSLIGGPSALQRTDSKQSLPDASTLDHSPVPMGREEVSRLSSQRREEVRRLREEEELLRSNPLRYIFHPAVKAWIFKRKLFLIVLMVNMSLSMVFYRLLSYAKDDDIDPTGPPD